MYELFVGPYVDQDFCSFATLTFSGSKRNTVKLGKKKRFDKEQIGIKEPFSVTNLPLTS